MMTSEERRSQIRVRLRGSEIGGTERQRQTIRGLGLRRIGDERFLAKTPAVLGMIAKVAHLVEVEDANGAG
jgi:large subunit ribosomal protein L30